jgi:hypothetical protein
MIIATVLLATLLIPAVWFFVRAQPRTERVTALKRFNVAVVVIALVVVTGVTFYFWETTGHSIDSAWWPILATLGSAFSVCVVLTVGIVVRLIIFRKSAAV